LPRVGTAGRGAGAAGSGKAGPAAAAASATGGRAESDMFVDQKKESK
jgi:hypothetical protein